MDYTIRLPKTVKGFELKEAIKVTASKLGWHYNETEKRYSFLFSLTSYKQIEVSLRVNRTLGDKITISPPIRPDRLYSKIKFYSLFDLRQEDLKNLTSTLYDVIDGMPYPFSFPRTKIL